MDHLEPVQDNHQCSCYIYINNYADGYPVQVEDDLYYQPIQAIDQGLYHTELVYI